MNYQEAQNIIILYANEMAPHFADKFQRFPKGGNAAMIVNYLNNRSQFWYSIKRSVGKSLAEVAAEIIIRSD